MYLTHFGLTDLPFTLTPNTAFYCNLPAYQEGLNTLLFSLRSGEGVIKIIGEVGAGKTLLCRKLLDSLGGECVTAYIPNPDTDAHGLRVAVAKELSVPLSNTTDAHEVLSQLTQKLIQLKGAGKRVIVIVDEAQALSDDTLEALRLLSNLETGSEKLLQIVLFAQPELDEKLKSARFRPLLQRIGFSYVLRPLTQEEVIQYVHYRLSTAGRTSGVLFTPKALCKLYSASKGVPRVLNILCHKALLVAYGRGEGEVSAAAVAVAITDSLSVLRTLGRRVSIKMIVGGVIGCFVLVVGIVALIYGFNMGKGI
jgi:MSHA biogenesis protein MshM